MLEPESTVVPDPRWTTLTPPAIVPCVNEPERLKTSLVPADPVIVLAVLIEPLAPPSPIWSVPASIWVEPVYVFAASSTIVPAPVFTRLVIRGLGALIPVPLYCPPVTPLPRPFAPVTSRSVAASPSATSNATVNVLSSQFTTLAAPRGMVPAEVLLITEVTSPLTVTVPVRAYGPAPFWLEPVL